MAKDKKTENKNESKKREVRNLDFSKCSRHGISYPKGGSCPKCDAESK
jgi:hypothetical protein